MAVPFPSSSCLTVHWSGPRQGLLPLREGPAVRDDRTVVGPGPAVLREPPAQDRQRKTLHGRSVEFRPTPKRFHKAVSNNISRMFVQEPLLALLGREGLEFYSKYLTELDDFWLEDYKMMTDGTSAKYENVEETTAKALRNARRSFSGDEELFKNKNGQGVYQHGVTNRNGLEFDQKHNNDFAPSEVHLGRK